MKSILSFLMCLVLLLTLALPVCAEEASTPPTSPEPTSPPVQTDPPQETQAPGHSHNWVKVIVPATCTEEGGTVIMCSIYEAVDSVELSPKAEHSYDNTCDPDCSVCGQTRETTHTFGKGWDYNSRKHWHICSICGTKGEELDHFPGPAATEERDQFCLTCGLLMTKKLAHTHKYGSAWQSDEISHWYACQGCQERRDLAAHIYDAPCDPDCSLCGYTRVTAHNFEEAYQAGESGHWQMCTHCQMSSLPEAHIPAEGADAQDAILCTVCGWELKSPSIHAHVFSESWQSDGESHWQECACGETAEKAPHTWQENDLQCSTCAIQRIQEPSPSAFPWGLVLAVLLILMMLCIGAVIYLLRNPR